MKFYNSTCFLDIVLKVAPLYICPVVTLAFINRYMNNKAFWYLHVRCNNIFLHVMRAFVTTRTISHHCVCVLFYVCYLICSSLYNFFTKVYIRSTYDRTQKILGCFISCSWPITNSILEWELYFDKTAKLDKATWDAYL